MNLDSKLRAITGWALGEEIMGICRKRSRCLFLQEFGSFGYYHEGQQVYVQVICRVIDHMLCLNASDIN
jgi:hypothetical protein